MRRFLVVASVLAACASAARFESFALSADVKLTVEEPAGAARQAWPVTSGIPFAEGELKDPQAVALLGDDGKRGPLQTEVLARWPDGSIRWLLADFQVDLRRASARTSPCSMGRAANPRRLPSRFEPSRGRTVSRSTPARCDSCSQPPDSACWTPCGWMETATAFSPTRSESPAPRVQGWC